MKRYVEPFFGSGAVLLGRPLPFAGREVVNDADGLLCNFWRALTQDPDAVAYHADWPVMECDLHARHAYLTAIRHDFTARLEGDPDYYDAKVAGWWVWGISAWIGSEFAKGVGRWQSVDGWLQKIDGPRVNRQLPHLSRGIGIHRKRPHLGNDGIGIHRKRPHLGDDGMGIRDYMQALHDRLKDVWVCCGDWSRVCGRSSTFTNGLTGVFLDPPYSQDLRDDVYSVDTADISVAVRAWCIENGDNPLMRIVLCGYEGEHELPDSWRKVEWKADGGYGNLGNGAGRENAAKERLWLSPHCLPLESEQMHQYTLF